MKNIKLKKPTQNLLLIFIFYLFISVAMYLFYRRDFVWFGDDIYYQFQRIMGLSANFDQGLLASNISPANFGKIGYGTNIFYPWLTLIPFRLVFQFTGDWISAYYKGLAFYFLVSLLISHYSMKKFSGSTKMAVIFTLIYNFSTYRLIEMFTRAALAEYLATIFLPLCFLGFYELFFGDGEWKDLAMGLSLIILTHVLSVMMCLIVFVLVILIFVKQIHFDKKHLVNFGKAVLSTVLATLVFTVPFISEELFQKYGVPDRQILQGQSFTKLLLSSATNNVHRLVENNAYNIGLVLLLALIAGVWCYKEFSGKIKAIYWLFLVSLLVTTNLFPWHWLQNTPIEVIQFPYRFLMFTTLFGSVIATVVLNKFLKQPWERHFVILCSVVTIVTGGLWMVSIRLALDSPSIPSPKLIITQKMINENLIPDTYLTQYIPKKSLAKFDTVSQHQVFVNGEQSVQVPAVVGNGNDFYFENVKKGSIIDLPYVRYKYTKAFVNGKSVPVWNSQRGSVELRVPENTKHLTIHLTYQNRKLFGLALIISIATWIYLLVPIKVFSRKSIQ